MLDCDMLYAIVLYANTLQPASSSTSALTSGILQVIGKIYLIGVELKLKLQVSLTTWVPSHQTMSDQIRVDYIGFSFLN